MRTVFIDNCEQEHLHLSGAIQSYGSLLVANHQRICTHVASNITRFIDISVEHWLDQPLPETLTDWCDEYDQQQKKRLYKTAVQGFLSAFDAVVSRNDSGDYVFELLSHLDDMSQYNLSSRFDTPKNQSQLQTLQQELVQNIAQITGFQRVMLYLFNEQGDGEVVAEAIDPDGGYGEYLGLRFPASDVPKIARDLYLKNPWRLIVDAAAEPCPVISRCQTPPDLSYADLRSVSPVHLLYLSNMGVRASLSFPLFFSNNLLGLVACHQNYANVLPQSTLLYLSRYVRAFLAAFSDYHTQQRVKLVDGLNHSFHELSCIFNRNGGLSESWSTVAPWLLNEFFVDGATLFIDEQLFKFGNTFEAGALQVFDRWFCKQEEVVWLGDNLVNEIPLFPFSHVAGALALKIQTNKCNLRLYLCRQEHIYEVAWGGNPNKPVEYHDGKIGIAPRRSFEKWVEKRLGYCRPWESNCKLLLFKLRQFLLEQHV